MSVQENMQVLILKWRCQNKNLAPVSRVRQLPIQGFPVGIKYDTKGKIWFTHAAPICNTNCFLKPVESSSKCYFARNQCILGTHVQKETDP